ncbi:hypothetical protein B0H13DRAFT_1851109 [Mycena leptocephala]|nr:hypothetical protein B0H13DRAFT_1851109 [Mycena leptocephala]
MPMDRASTLWGMEAVRVRVRDGPRGRTTVRGERGGRKQMRALGGRLPCIATYRLICLAVSWLGFHPMSQHTLFEAASRLDLGYEYVGTRSSSIAALRLQRREDTFANHLPSYSQLAEFATGGTEEGGDDKGRAGALIMNGDMVWTGTWYLCSAFVVAQLEYIYL